MPREKHQNGWVKVAGRREKKWIGHWRPYREDGTRGHSTVVLGLKAKMAKWEAEDKLRAHIAEETHKAEKPEGDPTFKWFWEHRFLPTRTWCPKTESIIKKIFELHVLPVVGDRKLRELEKFEIDVLVKKLAECWSGSLVQKVRIYTKAALEDAIDQGLLDRNPARKVVRPSTRAACRRFLSLDEIARLLDAMEGRDRLVARICIVLGLRPGEVFATKWDDFDEGTGRLRVDESAVDCEIKDTKTPGSRAWVWLPKSITEELSKWRTVSASTLIFPSRSTRPISTRNFLRRHIWPAAVRAGIMQKKPKDWPKGKQWVDPATSVNFRAFRRTCATWFHESAGTKNTQALLRHTTPITTLGVYVQELPESVRTAVEALDQKLCGGGAALAAAEPKGPVQ
jgi:integrase